MNTASLLAILYADVFNYPLKKEEREKWEISPGVIARSPDRVGATWQSDNRLVIKDGYYCLSGRQKLIKLRQQKQKYSQEKLLIGKKISNLLKFIPFIKLIAVTGALAVENSPKKDDIDLLIITQKNRVWLTRLLSIIFLEILGKRRRPKDKIIKDKICLNMFLDEENLCVPEKERNLYVAHEIAQIKPLYDKDNTYEKFHLRNKWVKEYLPKAISEKDPTLDTTKKGRVFSDAFNHLELLVYKLQYFYMKKRITRETVEKGRIMFHPRDTSLWVLKEFDRRVGKYTRQAG